jgi:hypothetical protein
MTSRLLVTLVLLLLVDAGGAVRVIEQVERAVELTLDQLTLPMKAGDAITFSECAACDSSTHRLLDSTAFEANGQVLPLDEFVRVATTIADKPNAAERAIAVVFLDVATGRVTRIELRE